MVFELFALLFLDREKAVSWSLTCWFVSRGLDVVMSRGWCGPTSVRSLSLCFDRLWVFGAGCGMFGVVVLLYPVGRYIGLGVRWLIIRNSITAPGTGISGVQIVRISRDIFDHKRCQQVMIIGMSMIENMKEGSLKFWKSL